MQFIQIISIIKTQQSTTKAQNVKLIIAIQSLSMVQFMVQYPLGGRGPGIFCHNHCLKLITEYTLIIIYFTTSHSKKRMTHI